MADIRTFDLPDLGEGLEEGDVVEWLVDIGDSVELNQEIVTVETAKAAVDIPVPFAGRLTERSGEPGDTLTVGEMLCRIDVDVEGGEVGDAVSGPTAGEAERPDEADHDTPGVGAGGSGSTGLDAEDEPQPLVGYGNRDGEVGGRRRRRGGSATAAASGASTQEDGTGGRPLAKPPVRKLAKDKGIDLAEVSGSGPRGSITREDLAEHEQAPQAGATPDRSGAPGPAPGGTAATSVPGFRGRGPGDVEQVAGIRKRIIDKMEASRRDIPHALAARDADLTELWELRKDLTEWARRDGSDVQITPNALIMRAAVLALRRFPTLNAVYDQDDGEIRLLEHINLGVAVDTDRGLIVPNIKDAHARSTLQLAAETHQLAEKCRDGTATPAELTGGTFTVDNYGYFGNDDGNPIINAPEAGILGVGFIREKPWIHRGEVAVRRVCRFQLAFDHRVCDGGEAGRFVTYVAELCEQPARILVHA